MVLRLWLESVQEAVVKVCLLNTSLSLAGRNGREEEGKLMARLEERLERSSTALTDIMVMAGLVN